VREALDYTDKRRSSRGTCRRPETRVAVAIESEGGKTASKTVRKRKARDLSWPWVGGSELWIYTGSVACIKKDRDEKRELLKPEKRIPRSAVLRCRKFFHREKGSGEKDLYSHLAGSLPWDGLF